MAFQRIYLSNKRLELLIKNMAKQKEKGYKDLISLLDIYL